MNKVIAQQKQAALLEAYTGMYIALTKLAKSFEAERSKLNLTDLAELIGRDRKIAFIKEIRSRYTDTNGQSIGLYEAKTLADGIYTAKGW